MPFENYFDGRNFEQVRLKGRETLGMKVIVQQVDHLPYIIGLSSFFASSLTSSPSGGFPSPHNNCFHNTLVTFGSYNTLYPDLLSRPVFPPVFNAFKGWKNA